MTYLKWNFWSILTIMHYKKKMLIIKVYYLHGMVLCKDRKVEINRKKKSQKVLVEILVHKGKAGQIR